MLTVVMRRADGSILPDDTGRPIPPLPLRDAMRMHDRYGQGLPVTWEPVEAHRTQRGTA